MQGTETCRVTMYLPRQVKIAAGSHAYIRFAGVRPWENHPFSIAWSQVVDQKQLLPTKKASGEDEAAPAEKPGTAVAFPPNSGFGGGIRLQTF